MRYLGLLVPAVLVALCVTAKADLITDDFSYANGDLTTVSGGNWTAHSGTGSFVQVASGAVVLSQGGGSREDVSRSTGTVLGAGGIWRYSFDVVVNGTDDASNVYFAHFKDDGTGFNARAFVAAPNVAGGNFTFGIGEVSGTIPEATFTTDFSYGTSYRLFGEYNFDTGLSALWVNDPSVQIFSTNADIGQAMTSMAFRQAAGNTSMTIDNLTVSSITAVPEPGSMALLAVVGGSLLAIRRRRAS